MDIKTKLETMIRARYPVIYINSAEEARIRRALAQVKDSMKKEVYCWSLTKGWHDLIGNRIDIKTIADKNVKAFDDSARREDEVSKAKQEDMLKGVSFDAASSIRAMQVIEQNRQARRIDSDQTSILFVLFDAHPYLENSYVERSVRDAARDFPKIGRDTMLLVSPVMKLNDDLQKDITVIDIDLPEYAEMKDYLDKFIERQAAAKPEIFAELTDADKEKLYKATMGLTLAEAENAISKAIVQDKKLSKDSIKAILEEKKQIVRKSGSLEYYETDMGFENNIGGLDRLKAWMTERQGSFSEDAEAFGISKPKGALLLGVQGCIAEGTQVEYLRGNRKSAGNRSLPIEVLYDKFNGLKRHPGADWKSGLETKTQSWDYQTGEVVFNKVRTVIDSGIKECIRIETDTNGHIELTTDHPVLMADGQFREAGQIQVGDKILVRGSMKSPKATEKRVFKKRNTVEGKFYHPYAWSKTTTDLNTGKSYDYVRTYKSRLVVEAHMNDMSYEKFLDILKTDEAQAKTLKFLSNEWDVHHSDEDTKNDVLGNLQIVAHDDHARNHIDRKKFGIEYTAETTVVSVESIGEKRTFDISMADPHNNFIVNEGIIVHNCGKSLVCQTLGSQWGLPVLRFDIGSIFQKFVGESEANMRKALKVAEAVAPCILWIDELEKGFAGMMESGDSGTSSRILSYFLTWLQINKHMIFVVATSNDVEKLPPELLRKGRLDEIFFIDLPTQEEREEIVRVHLRQRHRDPNNFNVTEIAYRAYGFSGAEIEQAIESGLHKAFSDGRRELTDEDVIANIQDTAPISQTMYKKVNSTRRWADDKARRASSFDFSHEAKPDWWKDPEERAAQDRASHPLN